MPIISYESNKKPALGQGIEISVKLPNTKNDSILGRLTGFVTWVGPEPDEESLRVSSSFLFGNTCHCGMPECAITTNGTREDILQKFGAIHGQEVRGTVSLNVQNHSQKIYTDFFRGKTVYNVVLRCNDQKQQQWEVARLSIANSDD